MPSNLQYSAAKTSVISRRLLGTKATAPKNIFRSTHSTATNKAIQSKSRKSKNEDKLVVLDYNVELDYQLPRGGDIIHAIDVILENPWEESSMIHSRYFTADEIKTHAMRELVHKLSGISNIVKNDILKYRLQNLPLVLVTVAQLYLIYQQRGNTYVDKSIELLVRKGLIRKFIITNAAPVVLKSLQKYQNGKITYGFENVEIVTKADVYSGLISEQIEKCTLDEHRSCLETFQKFVLENPAALFVDGGMFSKDELSYLLNLGFVTLTLNHMNEIESHQYAVSYPNCGVFLKLINSGRAWLVKTLSKNSHHEMLEEQLYPKWEGVTASGDSKMNNFRKPFYGYDLSWILADALGSGAVEVFNTPVGRGWKLTGKV